MKNDNCTGCEFYENEHCTKYRSNGVCRPSTRKWLIPDEYDDQVEFIPVNRMCQKGSIFGNNYIGLSRADVDRILDGEIAYIIDEYGVFIGLLPDET